MNDLTNQQQFDNAMFNAGDAYLQLRSAMNNVGTAISCDDPFALMSALAKCNAHIRECMQCAVNAQHHKIEEHKQEMQRFG